MLRTILYFHIFFLFIVTQAKAHFNWVEIGVNGLTCSQCSRSTELSIKKLDFVQDVQMDLEHTQGRITFKPGAKVSIEKIAKAVEDAGFSVRYLKADFVFDNISINNGSCFSFENKMYQFVKSETKTLKGEAQIKFLGKNFLPKKEFKEWEPELKPKCAEAKEWVFYVTLT
jgi:copper chaperone CopZ